MIYQPLLGRRRRGFTLIELLVVIAIIAILAAILFPVFGKAKQASQASACLSNSKQLGMACVLYADNYSGAMIPAIRELDSMNEAKKSAYYKTWRVLALPYLRSRNVYICPAMVKEAGVWSTVEGVPCKVPSQDIPATYGINEVVSSNISPARGTYTHMTSQYSRSARTIMIMEIKGGKWMVNWQDAMVGAGDYIHRYATRWHSNKVNIAFVDGHAKTMYLYDTIGTSYYDCMWWDIKANQWAGWPQQWKQMHDEFPKDYPPFVP